MEKNSIIRREICTPTGVQVRSAADGSATRIIEGYAIVFDTPSEVLWRDDKITAREMISADAVTQELLDNSDIFMTMFHDPRLILARSNKGSGTLSYEIDERGVRFRFEAPHTADGDKALELVRLGNLTACSFKFSVAYADEEAVERRYIYHDDGTTDLLFVVRRILQIYDFTISENPAYPATTVSARDLESALADILKPAPKADDITGEEIATMRRAARAIEI